MDQLDSLFLLDRFNDNNEFFLVEAYCRMTNPSAESGVNIQPDSIGFPDDPDSTVEEVLDIQDFLGLKATTSSMIGKSQSPVEFSARVLFLEYQKNSIGMYLPDLTPTPRLASPLMFAQMASKPERRHRYCKSLDLTLLPLNSFS